MARSTDGQDNINSANEIFHEFPELDRILIDGWQRGRAGVRAAVLRILSSMTESGIALTPSAIWSRLRRLKNQSAVASTQRSLSTADDETILRLGYSQDGRSKRKAIAEVLQRHPDWPRYHVWKLAKALGLLNPEPNPTGRSKERRPWTERETQRLLNRAGCDPVHMIAATLQRTPAAVHSKLASLGKRGKVTDSYSRRWVADTLHIGFRAVDQLLEQDLLKMQNPKVTGAALKAFLAEYAEPFGLQLEEPRLQELTKGNGRHTQEKIAELLAVAEDQVRYWVVCGLLQPVDERITYASFESYCQRNASKLNHSFMDRDHREWLAQVAEIEDWGPMGTPEVQSVRKHACIVRACPGCQLKIRGNVYFRHIKVCPRVGPHPATTANRSTRAHSA